MLAMQVRNRVGYMQDLMQNAQDLTDLSDYIDRATLSMVNTGRLDLDALNTDSEQSSALLCSLSVFRASRSRRPVFTMERVARSM